MGHDIYGWSSNQSGRQDKENAAATLRLSEHEAKHTNFYKALNCEHHNAINSGDGTTETVSIYQLEQGKRINHLTEAESTFINQCIAHSIGQCTILFE
jgi:hypothetical protein